MPNSTWFPRVSINNIYIKIHFQEKKKSGPIFPKINKVSTTIFAHALYLSWAFACPSASSRCKSTLLQIVKTTVISKNVFWQSQIKFESCCWYHLTPCIYIHGGIDWLKILTKIPSPNYIFDCWCWNVLLSLLSKVWLKFRNANIFVQPFQIKSLLKLHLRYWISINIITAILHRILFVQTVKLVHLTLSGFKLCRFQSKLCIITQSNIYTVE